MKTFRRHKSSNLHRFSISAEENLKDNSIVQLLSTVKTKEMEAARVALNKIFTTVKFLVSDVLLRYQLKFESIRGQRYDGASNVSGCLTRLQARIKEVELRALFVHCTAHKLNLVVQDAMEDVNCSRNFIGIIKELINFIRDSQKRLAWFKELYPQKADNYPSFVQQGNF